MRKLLILCLPLIWSTSGQSSKHTFGSNYTIPANMQKLGKINIEGYGPVYVVTRSSEGVELIGDQGFRISGHRMVNFATKDVDIGTDPFMYWQPTLADHTWSYDIDVSSVGCKCNAAMYFVMMPGYEDGELLMVSMACITVTLTSSTGTGAPSTTPSRGTLTACKWPYTPVRWSPQTQMSSPPATGLAAPRMPATQS